MNLRFHIDIKSLIVQVSQVVDKSDKLDEQTLKLHGCKCSSPNLEFTSTDQSIVKEHPEFFGKYSYKVEYCHHHNS